MTVLRHPNNQGVTLSQWRKTAAGGETSLSGTDDFSAGLAYTAGAEQVFVNGVLLERGVDYTASTGTTVTGLTALVAGDIVTVSSPSAFNVANAIPLSTVTAKGDLLAATGASTVTNLPVGADGTTLVADSSTSTGLRYQAPIQQNPVLNSAFQVAQRGTSFSQSANTSAYTMDRWQVRTTAANMANTVTRQNTSDTTNLPNIQYCARVQRNSGQTGTSFLIYEQGFETVNSIPFAGKTVTLSFYARAGANFSATSNVLVASLANGTGTDQMPAIYTGGNYPTQNNTLTTTWQRFSYTLTVPTTATELGIQLYYTPTGTAGANDYFEVTGVQLEVGSVATPFHTYAGTLQGELQACRRYLPAYSGSNNDNIIGYSFASNSAVYGFQFDTPARVYPTGITATGTFYGYGLNTQYTITPVWNAASTNGASVLGSPTIVAGQGSRLYMTTGSLLLFTGCEL